MGKISVQRRKLGILGGGQLGRMLIQSAMDFNLDIHILDPDKDAPCSKLATKFTKGELTDYDTVMEFAEPCDIITIEIENVNTKALKALKKAGKEVYPQPEIIELIQDKREQKKFYKAHKIPTAPFKLTKDRKDVEKKASLPCVNKLGREGYDGRGVRVIRKKSDLKKAFDKPGLIEDLIDFDKEIAVIVARNKHGQTKVFPPVEMAFHPEANLVEYLFAPAMINPPIEEKAEKIALKVIKELDMIGILAVEMFVTKEGEILVNEVAPRPHNSGHQTIEGNVTSQYEQHLRAIFNLPLGDTSLRGSTAMVNVLGEEGHTGIARFEGLEEVLSVAGAHIHLYGKKMTKPFRKMGHVTIEDNDTGRLKEKVDKIKNVLKVIADKK